MPDGLSRKKKKKNPWEWLGEGGEEKMHDFQMKFVIFASMARDGDGRQERIRTGQKAQTGLPFGKKCEAGAGDGDGVGERHGLAFVAGAPSVGVVDERLGFVVADEEAEVAAA